MGQAEPPGLSPFLQGTVPLAGPNPWALLRACSKAAILGTPIEPSPYPRTSLPTASGPASIPSASKGPLSLATHTFPKASLCISHSTFPTGKVLGLQARSSQALAGLVGSSRGAAQGAGPGRGRQREKEAKWMASQWLPARVFPLTILLVRSRKVFLKYQSAQGIPVFSFFLGSVSSKKSLVLHLASSVHVPACSLHPSCPLQAPTLLTSWRSLQHAMFSLTSGLCPC